MLDLLVNTTKFCDKGVNTKNKLVATNSKSQYNQ